MSIISSPPTGLILRPLLPAFTTRIATDCRLTPQPMITVVHHPLFSFDGWMRSSNNFSTAEESRRYTNGPSTAEESRRDIKLAQHRRGKAGGISNWPKSPRKAGDDKLALLFSTPSGVLGDSNGRFPRWVSGRAKRCRPA